MKKLMKKKRMKKMMKNKVKMIKEKKFLPFFGICSVFYSSP